MRSLTLSSFDFKEGTVTASKECTKNRRRAIQPIKQSRGAELAAFFAGKMPAAKAFNMPSNYRTGKMIKADMEEAGIEYIDDAGRKADFHALGHTFETALDRAGCLGETQHKGEPDA